MKQLTALILVAALLCIPALAESGASQLAEAQIADDAQVSVDLDGDGAAETILWSMIAQDEYNSYLFVQIYDDDGAASSFQSDIMSSGAVYVVDLNGDGVMEILVTGDEMSDDYVTFALNFSNGTLTQLAFANGNRGDNTEPFLDAGYGQIVDLADGTIALSGSQDVLGTWFATRRYALNGSRFEFADDGEWVRDMDGYELDDAFWSEAYTVLTTTVPLDYTDAEGVQAQLTAGEKLLITGSDKATYARFVTPDGITGTLAIAPDTAKGWGMLVNGVSEEECFDMIPYAD